jgi:hypothetical protein
MTDIAQHWLHAPASKELHALVQHGEQRGMPHTARWAKHVMAARLDIAQHYITSREGAK